MFSWSGILAQLADSAWLARGAVVAVQSGAVEGVPFGHREKLGTICLLPHPPGLAGCGRNEWERKAILLHLRSAKYRWKQGAPKSRFLLVFREKSE
jgi:hypothetical protein